MGLSWSRRFILIPPVIYSTHASVVLYSFNCLLKTGFLILTDTVNVFNGTYTWNSVPGQTPDDLWDNFDHSSVRISDNSCTVSDLQLSVLFCFT